MPKTNRAYLEAFAGMLWHLTGNCGMTDTFATKMVPLALRARKEWFKGEDADLDQRMRMPKGWTVNGSHFLTMRQAVELMYLDR